MPGAINMSDTTALFKIAAFTINDDRSIYHWSSRIEATEVVVDKDHMELRLQQVVPPPLTQNIDDI
jgi:ribosomal protein S3AE